MIFSVTANGTFMSTLSAGIVNIALPTMSGEFGVSLENIQLVVSLYLLVLTCFLPVFGKLSDLYSRKGMYLGGFIVFGVGALLGAVSGGLGMMLGVLACVACAGGCFAKWLVEEDKYQRAEHQKYLESLKKPIDK